MENQLIELLESFGFPVYRQGSIAKNEAYPANFFTFWNNASSDHSYYDNNDYGTNWDFNVYFYSDNPENTYTYIDRARILLKQHNWIVPSKGFDVATDEPTHTGKGLEVFYLQV